MRIAWLVIAAGCTNVDDGFGLEIEARGAAVVVVQDGDGAWERLATTPDGIAYTQIEGASYAVGALCDDTTWRLATFQFDTQPRTAFLPCPVVTTGPGLHVRGTTAPSAQVWIDGHSTRADAAGAFDLALYAPGLHDVVAILPTTPPRIVAQRAIAVLGDTKVDLAADAALEMTALYPTIVGADRSEVELGSDLTTSTDWLSLGTHPSVVFVPPASFLDPTDRPTIAAFANGCTRQHPLSAANEPLVLPAPLVYSLDRTHIAWTADPSVAWDGAIVQIESSGGRYSAFASASWREVNGMAAVPIVDLAALPGWSGTLPSLVPDQPALVSFSISRGAVDQDFTSCSASVRLERW